MIAAIKHVDPRELGEEYYNLDRMKGISVALSTLTEREEAMVLLRYKHSASFNEIGHYYGLTEERVRQIIQKALRKMGNATRFILIEKGLAGYIDGEVNQRVEERVKLKLFDEYMHGYDDGIKDREAAAEG